VGTDPEGRRCCFLLLAAYVPDDAPAGVPKGVPVVRKARPGGKVMSVYEDWAEAEAVKARGGATGAVGKATSGGSDGGGEDEDFSELLGSEGGLVIGPKTAGQTECCLAPELVGFGIACDAVPPEDNSLVRERIQPVRAVFPESVPGGALPPWSCLRVFLLRPEGLGEQPGKEGHSETESEIASLGGGVDRGTGSGGAASAMYRRFRLERCTDDLVQCACAMAAAARSRRGPQRAAEGTREAPLRGGASGLRVLAEGAWADAVELVKEQEMGERGETVGMGAAHDGADAGGGWTRGELASFQISEDYLDDVREAVASRSARRLFRNATGPESKARLDEWRAMQVRSCLSEAAGACRVDLEAEQEVPTLREYALAEEGARGPSGAGEDEDEDMDDDGFTAKEAARAAGLLPDAVPRPESVSRLTASEKLASNVLGKAFLLAAKMEAQERIALQRPAARAEADEARREARQRRHVSLRRSAAFKATVERVRAMQRVPAPRQAGLHGYGPAKMAADTFGVNDEAVLFGCPCSVSVTASGHLAVTTTEVLVGYSALGLGFGGLSKIRFRIEDLCLAVRSQAQGQNGLALVFVLRGKSARSSDAPPAKSLSEASALLRLGWAAMPENKRASVLGLGGVAALDYLELSLSKAPGQLLLLLAFLRQGLS